MTFVNPSSNGGGSSTAKKTTPAADTVHYKGKVPAATGDLKNVLSCMADECSGVTVTSTSEPIPQHPHGTPHADGEAADLRANSADQARQLLQCASDCGAQYGKNEVLHPSAHSTHMHVHIQTIPGLDSHHHHAGGRGDLPTPNLPDAGNKPDSGNNP